MILISMKYLNPRYIFAFLQWRKQNYGVLRRYTSFLEEWEWVKEINKYQNSLGWKTSRRLYDFNGITIWIAQNPVSFCTFSHSTNFYTTERYRYGTVQLLFTWRFIRTYANSWKKFFFSKKAIHIFVFAYWLVAYCSWTVNWSLVGEEVP